MFKTIVAGTDGSASAALAVEQAVALAEQSGGSVHVVTAYRPLSEREVFDRQRGLPPHLRDEVDAAAAARSVLERVTGAVEGRDVDVRLHARVGEAGHVLVRVAEEVGADLIVVGSRGMTGVGRVLGSVPNHVSHHASCSVLIQHTS
jgi:nucleotide-binding universal stress UspA family protein